MTVEELTGAAAMAALRERSVLQDGLLQKLEVEGGFDSEVSVTLTVIPRRESPVEEARIRISSLTRLDVAWDDSASHFYLVPGYKALLRDSGRVYVSLDPYDDRVESVDERDCFILEGESISVGLRMKP